MLMRLVYFTGTPPRQSLEILEQSGEKEEKAVLLCVFARMQLYVRLIYIINRIDVVWFRKQMNEIFYVLIWNMEIQFLTGNCFKIFFFWKWDRQTHLSSFETFVAIMIYSIKTVLFMLHRKGFVDKISFVFSRTHKIIMNRPQRKSELLPAWRTTPQGNIRLPIQGRNRHNYHFKLQSTVSRSGWSNLSIIRKINQKKLLCHTTTSNQ